MPDLSILIGILDARSFTSIWYWLGFALIWSAVTRNALGVPAVIVHRARREPGLPGQDLINWLRLVLPHWRLGGNEGVGLAAVIGFVLAVLWVLSFRHGLQLAQALMPLLGPLAVLLVLRIRLASRLLHLLDDLDGGRIAADPTAQQAARLLIRHGWIGFLLSLLSMLLAVMMAAAWIIRHPLGY